MKYIITEQQNNKIIDMIKDFANTYAEERVVRTDVEVEYDPKRELYLIYPIFYVKNKERFPTHIYKHLLAQKVEDYFGVPTHSTSARVKEIE
jgi:hypothetical protein